MSCSHFCFNSSTSYPAEKLPPIPFITATDALLSASNCVNCDASSFNTDSFNVFCLSARFIDRIVTALNFSTTTKFAACSTRKSYQNSESLALLGGMHILEHTEYLPLALRRNVDVMNGLKCVKTLLIPCNFPIFYYETMHTHP